MLLVGYGSSSDDDSDSEVKATSTALPAKATNKDSVVAEAKCSRASNDDEVKLPEGTREDPKAAKSGKATKEIPAEKKTLLSASALFSSLPVAGLAKNKFGARKVFGGPSRSSTSSSSSSKTSSSSSRAAKRSILDIKQTKDPSGGSMPFTPLQVSRGKPTVVTEDTE